MEKEYKMEQEEIAEYIFNYDSLKIENEEGEIETESTYMTILTVFREIFSLVDFSFISKK